MKFSVAAVAFLAPAAIANALVVSRGSPRIAVFQPEDLSFDAAQAKWTKYCVQTITNDLGTTDHTTNPYFYEAPDIYTKPAYNVFCSAENDKTAEYTDSTISWLGWEKAY